MSDCIYCGPITVPAAEHIETEGHQKNVRDRRIAKRFKKIIDLGHNFAPQQQWVSNIGLGVVITDVTSTHITYRWMAAAVINMKSTTTVESFSRRFPHRRKR